MSLGAFLTNEEFGSWADEPAELPTASANVDYSYEASSARGGARYGSPSRRDDRPRERRAPSHPIPDRPPFTAFVGNLDFNTAEPEIDDLFRDLNLDTIRLIRDNATGKTKGFAYVEFIDRESLERALTFDGEQLNGRSIRIDVSEGIYCDFFDFRSHIVRKSH